MPLDRHGDEHLFQYNGYTRATTPGIAMADSSILEVILLGNPPWPTLDPFLFCVHHNDAYPAGNEQLGPQAPLSGRQIGMDFEGKDGWRMYHGDVVPGFPRHPHRGFETVTIARRGYIDHADSMGATSRFGQGDVQWMTAGRGVVHSEMFPLIDDQGPNPTELFQIWLNLPRADKMVEPYFTMLWSGDVPVHRIADQDGRTSEIHVIAGNLAEAIAAPPPPNSWAARPEAEVAIWTIAMDPGARATLPATTGPCNRTLYFFAGSELTIAGRTLPVSRAIQVHGNHAIELENGAEPSEILLLQGRPIGEPVVQHGPFVMNSPVEIQKTIIDYHRTGFGGWPFDTDGPVHGRDRGRFAIHADGRVEEKGV